MTFSFTLFIALNTGVVLWFQQFYAMLLKRTYNSVRFWASIIWQFVLPLAFVLWALVLAKTLPGINTNEPPREMTINSSSLSDNQTFFWAQFGIDNDNLNVSYYSEYNGTSSLIRTLQIRASEHLLES